jgi:predicted 2-oxoglutarate/Fe(II)-dependent dioxygenase YbiX
MVYTEGSFFKPHTDASSYDAYLSAGYNLNKGFKGGDYIIKGHTIYPDIGELFTFGRDDMHEVTEITKGTRFSVHFAIKNTQKSLF